jgi:hypothetical protein
LGHLFALGRNIYAGSVCFIKTQSGFGRAANAGLPLGVLEFWLSPPTTLGANRDTRRASSFLASSPVLPDLSAGTEPPFVPLAISLSPVMCSSKRRHHACHRGWLRSRIGRSRWPFYPCRKSGSEPDPSARQLWVRCIRPTLHTPKLSKYIEFGSKLLSSCVTALTSRTQQVSR